MFFIRSTQYLETSDINRNKFFLNIREAVDRNDEASSEILRKSCKIMFTIILVISTLFLVFNKVKMEYIFNSRNTDRYTYFSSFLTIFEQLFFFRIV